jgi:mono/diheme cytochrome c family protein
MATTLEDAHGPAENWNTAIYHDNFMENSCSLCHGEFIHDQAPVLYRGQTMFYEYGCRGCHKVDGKPRTQTGPPLDEMGKRVKADWLYRFLKGPKSYLPLTKMPDPKFSSQESADVAAFFLHGPGAGGTDISGDPASGKTTLLESRCVSCHTVEGKGGKTGPELSRVSSKAYAQRLFKVIKDPHALWSESKMPIFGFADQDIGNMVTFMVKEYIDLELDEETAAEQIQLVNNASRERGLELLVKQGCIGCHSKIEGVKELGELGPDLTTFGVVHISFLDFGDKKVPHKDRTVPNWIYNKIKTPRLFKEGLKMPDYYFNEEQAAAITTYTLSLKGKEVPASYTLPIGEHPSDYAPQGAFGKILDKYRCLVCHKINGKGGEVANDLSQEGSRVQKAWIKHFMKAPDTVRPLLEERMTQFKILDPEDEAVYEYCRTTLVNDKVEDLTELVSKMPLGDPDLIREGEKLYYEKYACNACHQILGKGGLVGPDFTAVDKRLRPEWVVYYLHDPKAFVKRSLEPVYGFTDKEIEALTAFVLSPKTSSSVMH